jgi:hypothetical protein
MIAIQSDPDFTGVPLQPGSGQAWWQLTRDQWYVITRIVFREFIRAYAFTHPGQEDPNDVDLSTISYKVRVMVQGMMNDPTQAWSHIVWGMPIPWYVVACWAYWQASGQSDVIRWDQYTTWGCSPQIADRSYISGLAALNAPLDASEPFTDMVNPPRYEHACDAVYNDIFAQAVQNLEQPPLFHAPSTAGSGYDAAADIQHGAEAKDSGGVNAGAVVMTVGAVIAIGWAVFAIFGR